MLQPGQIRHLLRVTAATSRHPERDCLVLLLGLTAGTRVTEIAQIEVQDVLFPSLHSGRRTMASRLIQQGQDVETVQLLLGYAEPYASEFNIIFANQFMRTGPVTRSFFQPSNLMLVNM